MTTITPVAKKKLSFLREVQGELKKVNWTSRAELIQSTKVVLVATFLFGFAIYFADVAIRSVIDGLGALVRMAIG